MNDSEWGLKMQSEIYIYRRKGRSLLMVRSQKQTGTHMATCMLLLTPNTTILQFNALLDWPTNTAATPHAVCGVVKLSLYLTILPV